MYMSWYDEWGNRWVISIPIDEFWMTVIVIIVIASIVVLLAKHIYRKGKESVSAENLYQEEKRIREITRRLDAETECIDAYIREKRARAALEEIPEMISHESTKRRIFGK